MFLRRVFIKIDESEDLVQIYVQQLSYFVDQLNIIDGVHSHMVSCIISYPTACN